MLEPLGITPDAEAVYAVVAATSGTTADGVSELCGFDGDRTWTALRQLTAMGLLSTRPDGTCQALPLTAVANQLRDARIQDLDGALLAAETFERQLTAARLSDDDDSGIVNVVGRDAMQAAAHDLCDRAQREICILDQPPYATDVSPTEEQLSADSPEFRALLRGVAMRTVYHPGFDERRIATMTEFTAHGEQARFGKVPLKMILVDRERALIPAMSSYIESGPVRASVLSHPTLVEALQWLFDRAWESALPVLTERQSERQERTVRLIKLLMAGSTDGAIAGQLGVTERSVRRWVSELMDEHGVQTRLQLGAALVSGGEYGRSAL